MAEIVNLRMKRKEKARAEKRRQAEENRLRHGRSPTERAAERRREEIAARHVDGHRLSTGGDGGE